MGFPLLIKVLSTHASFFFPSFLFFLPFFFSSFHVFSFFFHIHTFPLIFIISRFSHMLSLNMTTPYLVLRSCLRILSCPISAPWYCMGMCVEVAAEELLGVREATKVHDKWLGWWNPCGLGHDPFAVLPTHQSPSAAPAPNPESMKTEDPQQEQQVGLMGVDKDSDMDTKGTVDDEPEDEAVDGNREVDEDVTCRVCYEYTINSVLVGCGHKCVCLKCARNLRTCPICRAKIDSIVYVKLD
jgi:hypothetical protein